MTLKLLRKSDIILALAVIISVCAFFLYENFSQSDRLTAQISVDGKIVKTVELDSLTEKKVIIPDTKPKVVIVAENGTIRFDEADCKDKLCVSKGILSKKGDTAVCLPAKTVVSIGASDVDAVTY